MLDLLVGEVYGERGRTERYYPYGLEDTVVNGKERRAECPTRFAVAEEIAVTREEAPMPRCVRTRKKHSN